MIRAATVRKVFLYNRRTGELKWRVSIFNGNGHNRAAVKAGDIAGSPHQAGYLSVMLRGRNYMCHRLAWAYVTGRWPKNSIDHIDGDRSNNAFRNLRDVSASMNIQNEKKARVTNQLGIMGVGKAWHRFRAHITLNGKYKFLGNFPTPEKAHQAYLKAKRKFHPGCTI